MDWLQFISSLAWPAVSILAIVVFRKPLLSRLENLSKFDIAGVLSGEFEHGVSKLLELKENTPDKDALSKSAGPQDAHSTSPSAASAALGSSLSDYVALRANPTGVVMEAWKMFQLGLRNAYVRITESEESKTVTAMQAELIEKGFLTPGEVTAIQELQRLRNAAAHSQAPISAASAAGFVEVVDWLNSSLTSRSKAIHRSRLGLN